MNLFLRQIFAYHKPALILLLIFLFTSSAYAQQPKFHMTYGISAEFGYNNKGESTISLSGAFGIRRTAFRRDYESDDIYGWISRHISPAFQTSMTIYYNGLGDNILDHFKTFNVDFINSILITAGHYIDTKKIKNNIIRIQPMNPRVSNVIYDEYLSSVTLGTNFIINNNNRNQRTGFANAQIGRILHLGYYNDGPPYNSMFIADGFDRWWTGGGFVKVYLTQGFSNDHQDANIKYFTNSSIAAYYDRFTGNIQDAYLSSNVFGFKYVPAKDLKENFYTRARYKFSFFLYNENYELSYQRMGHLPKDVQDMIHNKLKMPHHLSYSALLQFAGVQYSNVFKIPSK